MTGGQVSPATPTGDLAAMQLFGSIEPNFDIVQLAKGAGALFAARETVAKPIPLERVIEKAIRKKGFSLVEEILTTRAKKCTGAATRLVTACT